PRSGQPPGGRFPYFAHVGAQKCRQACMKTSGPEPGLVVWLRTTVGAAGGQTRRQGFQQVPRRAPAGGRVIVKAKSMGLRLRQRLISASTRTEPFSSSAVRLRASSGGDARLRGDDRP
ncbi:MAG: hypothetical protein P8Y25_01725, partial [Chromatiaceae bacterium]